MSYQVTIEPTGELIEVEEGQTILQAALRQGVWLPFACGHGTCATCKCQVLEGEVDLGAASSFALMDMERDEGKVLACCAIPQSDLVIEADIDVDPDFAGLPVQDYRAVVTRLVELSPTIRGVHLKLDRPMAFQAGQYVNLQLPGIEGTRAFSLANPPQQADEVELHVRLVEGGVATGHIHRQLKVGDALELSGPYGQFFVRSSQPGDLIFIAGGSGLSSPQSMILDLLARGDTRRASPCSRAPAPVPSCTTASCSRRWLPGMPISATCRPSARPPKTCSGKVCAATCTTRPGSISRAASAATRPTFAARHR